MRSFDAAVASDRTAIASQVSIRIGCMPKMNEARLAPAARKVRRLLGFNNPDE